MKVTKRQLRRLIKEAILHENLNAIVKKHASANRSIDDATSAALADSEDQGLGLGKDDIASAMEDYYDEVMGF